MTTSPTTTTDGWSLVDLLLAEQQQASAVERYASEHERGSISLRTKTYRDLIPVHAPGVNQQYAFEVDLDACSGCKACVTACHNLNGLEAQEVWRTVGLLHGGSAAVPILQHVTTSCHHCVEPACLAGCPVKAYEKDPVTGIVIHLDDQCIGCQYCILKCPYDAPKYISSKGIVRKCDMCRDRIAGDEAPACVQACPNRAIRITLVDTSEVVAGTETNTFLPGAPEPEYTVPTTVYRSQRAWPRNLLPADYFVARPQHAHLPLVFMLVFTQMSVGALVLGQAGTWLTAFLNLETAGPARVVPGTAALLLAGIGLLASIFHLGRPFYAFRAILGLRTSWLSREILAFSVFAGLATVYAAALSGFVGERMAAYAPWLGVMSAAAGIVAVFCSVMIYVDTRRAFWSGPATVFRFFASAAVLAAPAVLLVAWTTSLFAADAGQMGLRRQTIAICAFLLASMTCKLLFEAWVFTYLRHKRHTAMKRTALLLCGELQLTTFKRFFLAVVGGLLLPLVLVSEKSLAAERGFSPLFVGLVAVLIFVSVLVGELLERYLFFAAVVAPKMPGSPV